MIRLGTKKDGREIKQRGNTMSEEMHYHDCCESGVKYYERRIRVLESKVDNVRHVANGTVDNPFMIIGNSYFIQTVTHYYTGELVWVGTNEIAITKACWIADTGRFNEFISNKIVNESELFPEKSVVIIGRGSIISMTERELVLKTK